jgi:hypothetical protein
MKLCGRKKKPTATGKKPARRVYLIAYDAAKKLRSVGITIGDATPAQVIERFAALLRGN